MALLQWADEQKRSRVGVSTDMAGQNQLVNNESAHAVERMMSAQEMLGNLIVRSIAETGIRPAYRMIRDLLVRFQNATTPFKFRGNWVNVNPADWGDRSRMMVTVGTGAGEDQQRMASLQQIYQIQREMQQSDPMQAMVSPAHLFATLNDFIGLSGLSEASKYFADPSSPEGQQFAQQKAQEGQQGPAERHGDATGSVADAADQCAGAGAGGAGRDGQGTGTGAEQPAQGADRQHEGRPHAGDRSDQGGDAGD